MKIFLSQILPVVLLSAVTSASAADSLQGSIQQLYIVADIQQNDNRDSTLLIGYIDQSEAALASLPVATITAVNSLLVRQDPHCEHILKSRQLNSKVHQVLGAVGFTITDKMVARVYPHTPASYGGIQVGDKIVAVDGLSTAYDSDAQICVRCWGTPNTQVTVTFCRDAHTFSLIFTRIPMNSMCGYARQGYKYTLKLVGWLH